MKNMMNRGSIPGIDAVFAQMLPIPLSAFSLIWAFAPTVTGFDVASTFLFAGYLFPIWVSYRNGTGYSERTAIDRMRGWGAFFVGNFTAVTLVLLLLPQAAGIRSALGVFSDIFVFIGLGLAWVFIRRSIRDFRSTLDYKTSFSLISSAPSGFLATVAYFVAITIVTNPLLVWTPVTIIVYGGVTWIALMTLFQLAAIERTGEIVHTIPGDVALFLTGKRRITSGVKSPVLAIFLASLVTTSMGKGIMVLGLGSMVPLLISLFHPLGWWVSAGLAISADVALAASIIMYLRVTRLEFVEKLVKSAKRGMPG